MLRDGKPGAYVALDRIHYDSLLGRWAHSFRGISTMTGLYDYKFIADHTKKTGYYVDFKEKKCERFPLTHEFRKDCIEEDDNLLGEFQFGVATDSLKCVAWGRTFSHYGLEGGLIDSRTQATCAPVSLSWISKVNDTNADLISAGFTDITPGIVSTDVFLPPSFCTFVHKEPAALTENKMYGLLKAKFTK